jgi:hypothetical protein
VELKLNGTHQLQVHANDMKLLGDDINTIEKNTGTLIDISKKVDLEVNIQKTKHSTAFIVQGKKVSTDYRWSKYI